MALYVEGMARLARDQIAYGQTLQQEHRPAEVEGICSTCGGVSPCTAARRGIVLVDKYSTWLDQHSDVDQ